MVIDVIVANFVYDLRMGDLFVSSCSCGMIVSCAHPVAVLNAVFCMTCNLLMLVEDERGDHMILCVELSMASGWLYSVFDTLVGVSVFSVMWFELLMTSAISCHLWSSVFKC